MQYSLRYAGYYEVAKKIAFSSMASLKNFEAIIIIFISSLILFFNIGLSLSSFTIPGREFSRIVTQLDDTDSPKTPSSSQIILASTVIVFLALFLYVPGMAMLEGWLRDSPELREKVDKIEVAAIPRFEMIEDQIYNPGTIEKIRQLQIDLLAKNREHINALAPLIMRGYDLMAANADLYLDWYYSLPAEYLRLGAMITGVDRSAH